MVNSDLSIKELRKILEEKDRKIIELNRKLKELKRLAFNDDLTNALNRRGGMKKIENKIKLANFNNQPLTICFLDVDEFKRINDTLGHKKGNKILIRIADIISENIRKSDFVVRLGGDEFLIAFPFLKKKEVTKILKRISSKIAELNSYGISVSYGFSEYSTINQSSVEDLINIADMEMYKCKKIKKVGLR